MRVSSIGRIATHQLQEPVQFGATRYFINSGSMGYTTNPVILANHDPAKAIAQVDFEAMIIGERVTIKQYEFTKEEYESKRADMLELSNILGRGLGDIGELFGYSFVMKYDIEEKATHDAVIVKFSLKRTQ